MIDTIRNLGQMLTTPSQGLTYSLILGGAGLVAALGLVFALGGFAVATGAVVSAVPTGWTSAAFGASAANTIASIASSVVSWAHVVPYLGLASQGLLVKGLAGAAAIPIGAGVSAAGYQAFRKLQS